MRKFRIPNRLITDDSLTFSARRLGALFCAVSNRFGLTRKSLAMLSGLSGLSVTTVQSAIAELKRGGYLTSQRTYRFDAVLRHKIFDRTVYQVHKYLPGGYTLVSADLFHKKGLGGSAFVLALYLYQQGASRGRAFPSIRQMMDAVGAAKSTVCRALKQIKAAAVFLVRHCVRSNRAYAANSYFFLRKVECEIRPALGLAMLQLYTCIAGESTNWVVPKTPSL